jgi:hypothetical protein
MTDEKVTVGRADLRTALLANAYEPQIYSIMQRFGEGMTEPEREAMGFAYEAVQKARDAALEALGISLEDLAPPVPAPAQDAPARATGGEPLPQFN